MKTLGVFGDSWADGSFGHDMLDKDIGNSLAWYNHIPEYSATSHARGGSSLYYTYKQFLEHHANYDKIVVILTQYERIPEGFFYVEEFKDVQVFVPGINETEFFLKKYKKELTTFNANKLKAIREFYLWCQDGTICHDMGMLIVDKIKQVRPDAILINGFYHGQGSPDIGQNKFPEVTGPAIMKYLDAMIRGIITDVSDVEFPHLKVRGRPEIRGACHLSKEANLVLAKDIHHALITGVWNPIVPYAIPHENSNIDYYYGKHLW
jgi:hypothetical protein